MDECCSLPMIDRVCVCVFAFSHKSDKQGKCNIVRTMATSVKHEVHGQIRLQGEQMTFNGDETLHVCVRDTLRYDVDCIELGSRHVRLSSEQILPIDYRCYFDPKRAHMKFEQLKTIPGAITLTAFIERNEQLLYVNTTDYSLADRVDIELIQLDHSHDKNEHMFVKQ
jgi:uncharacterized lipoprotein YbaY